MEMKRRIPYILTAAASIICFGMSHYGGQSGLMVMLWFITGGTLIGTATALAYNAGSASALESVFGTDLLRAILSSNPE